MLFKNNNPGPFSTTIVGVEFKAPAGGLVEIPDDLCHFVRARGCLLTPLDEVAWAAVAAPVAVKVPLYSTPVTFDEDDHPVEDVQSESEPLPPPSSQALSAVEKALAELHAEQGIAPAPVPARRRGKRG